MLFAVKKKKNPDMLHFCLRILAATSSSLVASQKEYSLQSGNSQILDSDYLRFAGNWASSAFSTASFV